MHEAISAHRNPCLDGSANRRDRRRWLFQLVVYQTMWPCNLLSAEEAIKDNKRMNWAHAGTAASAAFLASLVEFVEALTIVLAVGTIRGWRSALMGAAAGVLVLGLLVALFGPALERVPLHTLQLIIGTLLLLFGMRWLRKAILRSAGVIGLHDETAIYAKETADLQNDIGHPSGRTDFIAALTSFKAVMLEGLEVVFIVIATGVGGMLVPAALAAAAAGVLVILVGVALRRPLARVPENMLKFAVGILLSAFGVFWVGEGLRFPWWGEDLALVALVVGFLLVSAAAVHAAKHQSSVQASL
ncbi:MAG: hypothetical protein QOJ99_2997 [Bryobacterales bacterium]|nr:hypothetical protein [Bryobacterales bacterium]